MAATRHHYAGRHLAGALHSNQFRRVSYTLAAGSTLSLSPGITVALTSGVTLEIQGTLLSVGTAASPITITSALPAPKAGDWQYIRFNGATAAKSVVAYTDIMYGSTGYGVPSMIEMISGANITLRDSQIMHGTAIAVYADDSSLPTITGNTIGDFPGAAISIPNPDVHNVSGNRFVGNQQTVVTHT